MIRWIYGYTRSDKIKTKLQERVGVTPIEVKTRERRLRWFVHIKRSSKNAHVWNCERITSQKVRGVAEDQRITGIRSLNKI